ncbi:malonate decarboxylase holo-ACP synthase [Companilactobacillus insicii]|uniref:malonate decarboxylase holo-ACP synthase n=1 Tax=Companilactobacillus insicii TaxID=1732567 RepID=UPI000F79C80C|nr:malonate decarboxylase holo-ACP synthase [Companilactobacillus insicii]
MGLNLLPHDLIKIKLDDFFSDSDIPSWVIDSLKRAPLVIVRRGILDGKIPVGVRGVRREQRFPGFISSNIITGENVISPRSLVNDTWKNLPDERLKLPAFKALPKIATLLEGYQWGIGGSAGFELASGQPTAKMTSDLDLIWYENRHLSHAESVKLLKSLNQFGVHADFQVVHGQKGFSLEEFANNTSDTILIKTANGPKLSSDPWTEIEKDKKILD